MKPDLIKRILEKVNNKSITVEEALDKLKELPFEELGFAKIDNHRHLRKGFPEVVFAEGKESFQISQIIKSAKKKKTNLLITRVKADKAKELTTEFPELIHNEKCRALFLMNENVNKRGKGIILVISAGTSDIYAAEEAAFTSEVMGNEVLRLYDVGIAGIHRLFAYKDDILSARVIVVAAGMEGALPGVVAGLVDKPVIALPTSVGYGASFNGITALLSMLNSCANGIAVVNIDNGFGAGYLASMINSL